MNKRKWVHLLVMLAALALGVWLGSAQLLPPKAPDVAEEVTSIETAGKSPDFALFLSHIKAMAKAPHLVSSPALIEAQKYLTDQFDQMGFAYVHDRYELSMEDVLTLRRERADYYGSSLADTPQDVRDMAGLGESDTMVLNNYHVLVDAPNTEETIIFVSHTDSVKEGPGAFDDTVAVAAMLEGLRKMQNVTPKRDLLFLFTDGEEQALLGAALFVKDYPQYKEKTSLVINLEARGNSGALLMFETSRDNLGIINSLKKAVSKPVSFSIANDVYRMMQNDTDLT